MMNKLSPAPFLLLTAALSAQTFSYPDFSSVAQLNLLGNAAQSGTALRLTANVSNQTGWAWRQTAVPVVAGFDTTFTFRITPPTVGTKAEGMALVIHDDPNGASTLGGTVWGMGYGVGANSATGIRNSIAIELDTYLDGFLGDTSANELTIHTRGPLGNNENEQWSIGRNTPTQNLSNAQIHTLRVRYVPGTIEVFVDNATTPAISRTYSLQTGGTYLIGGAAAAPTLVNGTAFVGFCATTGAGTLTELVEILSWNWTSTPLTHPCYEGSFGQNPLTVNGSTGGLLRRVGLNTFFPFTIDLQPATGVGSGAPFALFASLLPQPGALGTNLGFGQTCFPVLPTGATELVLADSFGLFPAIFPAGGTPFTLALPGIVTSPLDLTVQAVTLAPGGLGITNAVDLRWTNALPPIINTVNPLSAQPGASITITGSRFLPGAVLRVNGTPVAITSQTATQIVFPYPAGIACGSSLSVTNLDGQAVTGPLNPNPNVTGTALGSGPAAGGATFIILGNGFASGSAVTIGGASANVQSATSGAITVQTPPGTAGVAAVVVTTPGGCTANTTYTYN
jgi:hypothetical protein